MEKCGLTFEHYGEYSTFDTPKPSKKSRRNGLPKNNVKKLSDFFKKSIAMGYIGVLK